MTIRKLASWTVAGLALAGAYAALPERRPASVYNYAEWQKDAKRDNILPPDSPELPYKIPKTGSREKSSLDLKTPTSLDEKITLDSGMNSYTRSTRIGTEQLGEDETISFDEFQREQNRELLRDYFRRRAAANNNVQNKGSLNLVDKLNLGNLGLGPNLANLVDIRPQGQAEVIFSLDYNRVQNPTWSLREQRNITPKFDQKIQFNIQGSIADKIKLGINFDTHAAFDFDNQRKINYEGKEDEIIQSIQAGDIAFPTGGTLISGSNSIFGLKTKLRFGKLDVQGVYAQARSEKKEITMEGGAQRTKFSIIGDAYDVNRHYFLAQYFRDNYNTWNANWPSLSQVQITRVECWVTNVSVATTNTRSVIGFQDMGEGNGHNYNKQFVQSTNNPYADNNSNNLYANLMANRDFRYEKLAPAALNGLMAQGFDNTVDYYVISNARQLSPSDFTVNPKLGYISLNTALNPNEALAVAFEYTVDGKVFKVGEFARDVSPDATNPNYLFLKLLKSPILRPKLPMFQLMMKNIYSLNAFQIKPNDFRLQVLYVNDKTGTRLNYIPLEPTEPQLNGVPLISLLELDKLNAQLERKPDGNFDYLEGVTINSQNGRVIFPVLEPFGNDILRLFKDSAVGQKYTFQELYDSTHTAAIQVAQKNRYYLEGYYQSSNNSVISLNAINVPQGSVKVYANNIPLVENQDYTVEYNSGTVTIINQSVLNSGSVIKVEAESNNLFNIQQKTLAGTRLDYRFNKDFVLGSTVLYLRERPLTPKSNVGDEPIRNTIMGADGRWRSDSRLITRIVDALPFLQTKEKSEVSLDGEIAYLHPGHPKLANDATDKESSGVSYIDDFEGSLVPYDLRLGNQWVLASAPRGNSRIPEANLSNDLRYGYKRAKLAWYLIDNMFYRDLAMTPENIRGNKAILSDPYQREVTETEVFPNKQIPNGSPGTTQTFDLHFWPQERGPYNFNTDLNPDGTLKNPANNWGGIMRKIDVSDFEAFNIEYLEFWMMDPFQKDKSISGDLYINLGNISEDILRDERKSYENGLPIDGNTDGVDKTAWGYVPNSLQINNAFSTTPGARKYQDVGYDGLRDEVERQFHDSFLNVIKGIVTPDVYAAIEADPSNDNFRFYRATHYDDIKGDILTRYRDYNMTEGNTPESAGGNDGYGSQYPEDEDINRDLNLEKSEDYYEYRVRINPQEFVVGRNYITSKQESRVVTRDGKSTTVTWYQFKIPVRQFDSKVGDLTDFRSIRFIRMYMQGFNQEVITRFARFQLIRGDWRKYLYSLQSPGDYVATDTPKSEMILQAVNLEENGARPNIPYVLPPGIQRTVDYGTPSMTQQNEQALSLRVCDIADGDARAIFKNVKYDMRLYSRLKMFIHAEAQPGATLRNGQLRAFIRLGTDFNMNYYEFEIPLEATPYGVKDPNLIWPEANRLNVDLKQLSATKSNRDLANWPPNMPFKFAYEGGVITVVGNPNLGDVRTLMIGIRNPKDDGGTSPCAEIWVNELRLAQFDEKGGWAAVGRAMVKAADFARFEVTGSRRSIGFGGLEQSVQERSQQDATTYGFSSNFELGKFFPAKYNVRIPMFISYSAQVNRPRYNPISPDIELSSYKSATLSDQTYDSLLRVVTDYTRHKSVNLTGIQKQRTTGVMRKPQLWDIENLNGTYVYNEVYRRNVNHEYDFERTYSAQLTYSYNWNTLPWQPFKQLKNKNLTLFKDFNLYYAPQSLVITGRGDRLYGEKLYRNVDDYLTITRPQYNKTFTLSRRYDFRHYFSRSLRFTYGANTVSRVEEPIGALNTREKIDSVRHNVLTGGQLNQFQQNVDLSWDLPISKIPYLEWVSVQTNYKGSYEWRTAPPAQPTLGATIQNSQTKTLNANLNFNTLYGKSKYLRNISQWRTNAGADMNSGNPRPATKDADKKDTKKKKPTKRKRRNTKKKAKKADSGFDEEPLQRMPTEQPSLTAGEQAVALFLSLKTANLNYSRSEGQLIAGFKPTPQLFGTDLGLAGSSYPGAPGLPFVVGIQDSAFRYSAADRGWITMDTNLSTQYNYYNRLNITGNIMLEPIKNMRITIDFSKQSSMQRTETFRFREQSNGFASLSPMEIGSYSISYLPIATAFVKDNKDNTSRLFKDFENNRMAVARELQAGNPNSQGNSQNGYPRGYGRYSQDVLLPAFVAAYSGKSQGLSPFINMPAPNWRMSYTGRPIFNNTIKTWSLSHGYRGLYSLDGYRSSLDYNPYAVPMDTNDLVAKYNIDRVTISERFEPLIGIDATFAGKWTGRAEFRKDRTLSLSFVDRRLSETKGAEFTIGAGYRTNELVLPRLNRRRNSQIVLKNDFTFRLDLSYRDQKQVIRILDNEVPVISGGQRSFALSPNIQYVLSRSLTLNIFFKRNYTKPYTSNSFPTAFTSGGFSLQYILIP